VSGMEVELDFHAQEPRQVLLHAAPLVDAARVPYAKVTALLDITEIKRERERAQTRARQQAIIADLGLRALDAQDFEVFLAQGLQAICIGASADCCELTRLAEGGNSLEPLASWPPAALPDHPELAEPGDAALRALELREPIVLSSGQPFPEDWPRRLQRQGVRAGALIAIRTAQSAAPFGVLGIYRKAARDFSQEELIFLQAIGNVLTSALQRQLLEQVRLRESQEAAQRESEHQLHRNERLASLGTFATGIAHELNNPLSNIVLSSDYAAKTPDSERRVKLLDAIRENALRCGRIVESVLRFARDEETERWVNALNPIVRHAAAQAVAYAGADKLGVSFDLAEPGPHVNCNPTEIEQVFVNLLKNAAQAQTGRANVSIRSLLSERAVRVFVSDDGPGISTPDLERIFDPFYSTQRAAGGTGLGLSISHRILATHGGSIRATSSKGRGATFEIELPIAKEADIANRDEG
jgi:signal transduction histidine kinase